MNPNTTEIYVWQPGAYYITTNLHHIEPCQLSIFKNGAAVLAGIFSSPTGATQATSTLIHTVTAADMTSPTSLSPTGFAARFQLVNHTSYAPLITLDGAGGAGSAVPDITCYMSFVLLQAGVI